MLDQVERKHRLLMQVEPPDESIIRGEGLIPLLEELGLESLEQVVSVGRNRFLVISEKQLTEYDGRDITTSSGHTLRCKHPGPPSVTITAFGCNVDWPHSVLTDKLHDHYEDIIEIKFATYRNWPSIRNGLRHIKVRAVNPDIPRTLIIEGRTVKIRLPGESIRDARCYRCGKVGHNRADCPDEAHTDYPIPNSNRLPGESIRDARCYRCGKVGHDRADCPDEAHTDYPIPNSNHTPTQPSPNSSYADQLKSPPIDPPLPLAHPTTQSTITDHRPPPPKQQTVQQTPPQHQLKSPHKNTTLGDFITVTRKKKTPPKKPTIMPPPNSIPKPKTYTKDTSNKDKDKTKRTDKKHRGDRERSRSLSSSSSRNSSRSRHDTISPDRSQDHLNKKQNTRHTPEPPATDMVLKDPLPIVIQ